MKGLLLKDVYTLLKQVKFFIVLIVVFSFIPGYSMSGFALVYASMLPITALAYDERSKWDTLAVMMPYSPRDIVLSKYLLGYLCIAFAGILSASAQFITELITHTVADSHTLISMISVMYAAAVILAINLPIMFRIGVEKGRIAFFVLFAAMTLGVMAISDKATAFLSVLDINPEPVLIVAFIATLILNVVSVMLSTRLYRYRTV